MSPHVPQRLHRAVAAARMYYLLYASYLLFTSFSRYFFVRASCVEVSFLAASVHSTCVSVGLSVRTKKIKTDDQQFTKLAMNMLEVLR